MMNFLPAPPHTDVLVVLLLFCCLPPSGEQLNFLMDTVASGHTFMDTEQTYHATRLVIESLTLEVRAAY